MKKIILIFIFCIFIAKIHSQVNNFYDAMKEGNKEFDKGEYKKAINYYFAAAAFMPENKGEVKEKVNKAFDAIEALRKKAEDALAEAKKQANLAIEAKREAEKQKDITLEQKEKLEALYSFMKYNNLQLFNEIQRNKNDLLYYSLSEYNLLNKYQDSIFNYNYRFYALSRISEYYEINYNLDSAYQYATGMCRLYPDSAISFLQRSIVNYYMGNWEEGLADADTALQLHPNKYDLPITHFNKGLILSNLGRYKDSRIAINEAKTGLIKLPETETFVDHFVSDDIVKTTSIYTLFITRNYQVKALEIYAMINEIFEGISSIQKLENLEREKLHTSILLSIINYIDVHLNALPDEYIGYLIKGYFWEMANYEEPAKANYQLFLKNNKELQNKKFNQYKNNFHSPIFNKLKN